MVCYTPQDLLFFACEQHRPDVLRLCIKPLVRGTLKQARLWLRCHASILGVLYLDWKLRGARHRPPLCVVAD